MISGPPDGQNPSGRRVVGNGLNTLSGRFLILTTMFVVLAEVMILLPGLAGFRKDYLLTRLERAQIASLALLTDTTINASLEKELLANAGVFNVVLRRDTFRQLVLSSPIPEPVSETYDLRSCTELTRIRDALHVLFEPGSRVIRVIGEPVQKGGIVIEVTLATEPMRIAMVKYGLRLLSISGVFSVITAVLLFLLVRALMVVPIKQVVAHMSVYAEDPEDARRIIRPEARVVELRVAEEALALMQRQLTALLRQKERLAQLGQAVAKISHDLRNILTTAHIFADLMESSEDPAVQRAAPKLMNSIGRAINLCETTLAFGKAEEPPPTLSRFRLAELAQEVTENEEHLGERPMVDFVIDMPPNLVIRADREQLYRVLDNLVRNAHQAIKATGQNGTIRIGGRECAEGWWVRVQDSGPGLPERARDHLFQPFTGAARRGGTGLGLAIAAELIRGHGGRLDLARTDETGTEFRIFLPSELDMECPPEKRNGVPV